MNCREVTRLLSDAQERELFLAERLKLSVHLAMCPSCSNFKQQMGVLRSACRRYAGRAPADPPDDHQG